MNKKILEMWARETSHEDFETIGIATTSEAELTESELALLAQFQCNRSIEKLINRMDDLKAVKNILTFFCVLTCISLAVGLLSVILYFL